MLLIDTDIGDDIDDAFALLCAMRQGGDLIGITTVYRDTVSRARIARRLLSACGQSYARIPVYAGHTTPLASAPIPHHTYLCQYTGELDDPRYAPDGHSPDDAVDCIIDACYRYGRALTIVALGPLTNLARVIEKDPTALCRAGKTVIMGGAYFRQYADWNVLCDVEAAAALFAHTDNLACIGADVTHQLDIGEENSRRLYRLQSSDPATAYALSLYRLWHDCTGGRAVLHDPLAVLCALNPALCRMEEATVVPVTEGVARGITLNRQAYRKAALNPAWDGERPICTVAAEVEKETVLARFMQCFQP